MAIVKGNGTGDTLNGVAIDNDIIYGLGGNDTINGGAGNDTLFGEAPFYQGNYYLFSIAGTWVAAQADAVSVGGNLVTINDAAENQWLTANFRGLANLWLGLTDQSIEGSFAWINGETTTATYRNWLAGQPTNITGLEDFASLAIASGLWSALPNTTAQRGVIEIATVLTGDDSLDGGTGNDTLVGGVGNDTLNGGTESDTADYSSLTQAITLLPTGTVNKGTAGTDQLTSIERIIGATGQANVIDASTATNFGAAATVNINLATQSVVVTTVIATPPSISLTAINFVNAIGTANNDTITGDTANNTLSGGGGNDSLNGGGGNDQIFGDINGDINSTSPVFNYNGKFYLLSSAGTWTQAQAQAVSFGGNLVTVNDAAENQFLLNTFGSVNPWIGFTDQVVEGQFKWANGETVTYTNWNTGEPNNGGGIENYAQLIGAPFGGKWNDLPNAVSLQGIIEIAASNDTIIGSTGNDTINGGVGIDTANYSAIGQAITLLPTGIVNKGTAGTDQLIKVETIIGATGLLNVIDNSSATGATTINANLGTQSLVVNADGLPTPLSFTVTNFVNVIGTKNNDTITGDVANNTLSGGGGNDSLNGGGGNDQIFGDINSTSPVFNYNGKSYLLSSAGTWTQAQAQAVSFGGNLVTVNDAAENQFLVNTFGTERLWIGLTDEVVEGQFKWVNGEAFTYNSWDFGQPDDFRDQEKDGGVYRNGEDYVEINYVGIAGKWNDLPNNAVSLRGIIEIAASNDTIIGSTGNDTINGGVGIDTADYSAISQAVTLQPLGVITKGTAGTDQLIGIETIIGATGLANTIDSSTTPSTGSINVSLASQSLVVNTGVATPPTISLTVINFANVIGTVNDDTITGNESNNTLLGGSGLDTLIGRGGKDILNGGDGDDQIFGDYSFSTTTGDNDTIIGSAGDDLINGELGTDTVNYSSLTDAITLLSSGVINKGIFGTDQILNIETVIGATGQANAIDASTGVATTTSLNADLAVNRLTINGLPAPINSVTFNVQNFVNIVGTTQGDTLKGNTLANNLIGNEGNDFLQGNNGDDFLNGGDGNDQLFGGENNDQLLGGLGNDLLQGDNGDDLLGGDLGNDTLRGGNGDDILDGNVGNDNLSGGANNDVLLGDLGEDSLNGDAGDDLLFGNDGNDILSGGTDNDELNGGTGRDLLNGGAGNDIIFGNEDNDTLVGDAGDDLLHGGLGNDILQGGLGNDKFAIAVGNGSDIIKDFQDGLDKIGLSSGLLFTQLTVSGLGTNTFIRNTSNAELLFTLQNVNSALITSVDFVTV